MIGHDLGNAEAKPDKTAKAQTRLPPPPPPPPGSYSINFSTLVFRRY